MRNGTIASVVVRSATGPGPTGKVSSTGNAWVAAGNFVPNTAYAAVAKITDTRGHTVTRRWHFVTGAPATALHTTLNVGDGGVYGVGMPIIVDLNSPISADRHAALEKRLTVTAPAGVVGGWHWVTDSELHWRPQVFWPAHTKVSLKIDFAGFDAGKGVWGVDGRTVHFGIGDSHISIVDVNYPHHGRHPERRRRPHPARVDRARPVPHQGWDPRGQREEPVGHHGLRHGGHPPRLARRLLRDGAVGRAHLEQR